MFYIKWKGWAVQYSFYLYFNGNKNTKWKKRIASPECRLLLYKRDVCKYQIKCISFSFFKYINQIVEAYKLFT